MAHPYGEYVLVEGERQRMEGEEMPVRPDARAEEGYS